MAKWLEIAISSIALMQNAGEIFGVEDAILLVILIRILIRILDIENYNNLFEYNKFNNIINLIG